MLRFEKKAPEVREARGLVSEAAESFRYVYVGDLQIGSYFRVANPRGDIWRWSILFPISSASGIADSESEARATFSAFYADLLRLTGLLEPLPQAMAA
jgi:hypothetical protein